MKMDQILFHGSVVCTYIYGLSFHKKAQIPPLINNKISESPADVEQISTSSKNLVLLWRWRRRKRKETR